VGFTAVPEALRSAGKAGQDAVGEVRNADCGSPVEDVSGALPGSKAAGAASSFASTWKTTFLNWCDDAERHANALTQAAETYVEGDHHAQSSLPAGDKLTGPR
jgi:hypothetical protein